MKHLRLLFIIGLFLGFNATSYAEEEKAGEKKAETPAAPAPADEAAPKDEAKKEFDPKEIAGKAPEYPLQSENLKDIVDDYNDEIEARKIEFRPMLDILEALRATSQEELIKRKSELTYKQLMKDPQQFRGNIVKLTGVLHQVEQFKVPENRTGITKVWQGQIANAQRQIITFVTIEPLPPDVKIGKAVDITGIFMKRYAYLNQQPGDKLTWCPLVFVRRVERNADFDKPQQSGGNPALDVLGAVVFLVVGVGCVFYFWGRQKTKNARANHFTKLKEERSGGTPLFPGPKPAPPKPKVAKLKAAAEGKGAAEKAPEPAAKAADAAAAEPKTPESAPDAPPPEKKD